MQKKIIILFLVLLFSCKSQVKFDKTQWASKNDIFPCECREKMVEDLIVNYKLIGLTKNKLKTILGSPDFNEDLEISYSLDIDYGTDIDPVYHRYLTFELTKDSVVKKYQIKEWRK